MSSPSTELFEQGSSHSVEGHNAESELQDGSVVSMLEPSWDESFILNQSLDNVISSDEALRQASWFLRRTSIAKVEEWQYEVPSIDPSQIEASLAFAPFHFNFNESIFDNNNISCTPSASAAEITRPSTPEGFSDIQSVAGSADLSQSDSFSLGSEPPGFRFSGPMETFLRRTRVPIYARRPGSAFTHMQAESGLPLNLNCVHPSEKPPSPQELDLPKVNFNNVDFQPKIPASLSFDFYGVSQPVPLPTFAVTPNDSTFDFDSNLPTPRPTRGINSSKAISYALPVGSSPSGDDSSDMDAEYTPTPTKRRSCRGRKPVFSSSTRTSRSPIATRRRASPKKRTVEPTPAISSEGGIAFMNFTAQDANSILSGVAPSGSSKTKARRAKEEADRRKRIREAARRAVEAVGGDLTVLGEVELEA